MGRLSFFKKIIFVTYSCGVLLAMVEFSLAIGAEGKQAVPADQSACSATLLKNKDYFPSLIKAMDESESEIIMSFFLFKAGVHKDSYPDMVLAHLAQAAKRGVKIMVILENTGGHDRKLDAENQQTKQLLEEKGVDVYFDSPRQTTHTKLIVIDQRLVLLGSHNLTQAALKYNNEISILLDSPDLAKHARNYMLKIIKEAK